MASIFINPNILREEPSDVDFLSYDDEINRVKKRLNLAAKNKRSIIIAYLGAFGVGKSSILNRVKKQTSNKYIWTKFETWKYSDRNELWKYFTSSIVSQIKNKSELITLKRLDGRVNKPIIKGVVFALSVLILSTALSYILWQKIDPFFSSYIKYALPIATTIIIAYIIAKYIQPKSPLRHILQFEDQLRKTLSKLDKPLIIVVEDVDRSGEDGIIFLETLHMFLYGISNKHSTQPVIIIAPQKNDCFDALGEDRTRLIESSLKIYDEKMYFNTKITLDSVDNFYKNIKFNKKYNKYKPAIIEITKLLVPKYQDQLTIRLLKHALREMDWFIQTYSNHSPAIAFVFAIARMIKRHDIYGNNKSLAVRRLKETIHMQNNSEINLENIFGITLAIAAGASETGDGVTLTDGDGKFAPKNITLITFDSSIGKDCIFKHDPEDTALQVSILKDYDEQLTI